MSNIHIEGRRWFQKTYGNTYNSVTIHIDGKQHRLPPEYGYGDYYLQRAMEWLEAEKHIKRKRYANGNLKEPYYEVLKRYNISYSVADVRREKDL